jgi:hypothetical protein
VYPRAIDSFPFVDQPATSDVGEVDTVDRLTAGHKDVCHHVPKEQAVLDNPWRGCEPPGLGGRIVERSCVVGNHVAVWAARGVAQRYRGDPAHRGAQPVGEQLKGDRAVQGIDEFGRVGDDNEALGGRGDDLLAGVGCRSMHPSRRCTVTAPPATCAFSSRPTRVLFRDIADRLMSRDIADT